MELLCRERISFKLKYFFSTSSRRDEIFIEKSNRYLYDPIGVGCGFNDVCYKYMNPSGSVFLWYWFEFIIIMYYSQYYFLEFRNRAKPLLATVSNVRVRAENYFFEA